MYVSALYMCIIHTHMLHAGVYDSAHVEAKRVHGMSCSRTLSLYFIPLMQGLSLNLVLVWQSAHLRQQTRLCSFSVLVTGIQRTMSRFLREF